MRWGGSSATAPSCQRFGIDSCGARSPPSVARGRRCLREIASGRYQTGASDNFRGVRRKMSAYPIIVLN